MLVGKEVTDAEYREHMQHRTRTITNRSARDMTSEIWDGYLEQVAEATAVAAREIGMPVVTILSYDNAPSHKIDDLRKAELRARNVYCHNFVRGGGTSIWQPCDV